MGTVETERSKAHTCHAKDCTTHVPPHMFMCRKHWYMLPKEDRYAIWDEYIPGQEITMTPTDEYLAVAMRCVELVARLETTASPTTAAHT